MSHIMKRLGVKNAKEWSALAAARPADTDEAAVAARRQASEQMLAIIKAAGVETAGFAEDAELLITGRMETEEYRAYLTEKYKEPA